MPRSRALFRAAPLLALAAVFAAAGCGSSPVAPSVAPPAALSFSAAVVDPQVQSIVVQVTAADIPAPLVFTFPVRSGQVVGEVSAPAGSARTITAQAYDATGIETHRGSTLLTLRSGTNPPLSLTMEPLVASQPITVAFAQTTIVVTPAVDTVAVGDTVRFRAAITDARGAAVPGPARWATDNPAIASVDSAGLLVGRLKGQVYVVATYQGVAGRAVLLVR